MSDPFDDRLRTRLERLTAAIPVAPQPARSQPPGGARRRSFRAIPTAAAMVMALSLGGTAAFVALNQPHADAGAFSAGGPLHCSRVDQLAPRAAERWMTARGIASQWQLEDHGTTTLSASAPDHGSIVSALVLDDRTVLVLVDLARDVPLPPRPCP